MQHGQNELGWARLCEAPVSWQPFHRAPRMGPLFVLAHKQPATPHGTIQSAGATSEGAPKVSRGGAQRVGFCPNDASRIVVRDPRAHIC